MTDNFKAKLEKTVVLVAKSGTRIESGLEALDKKIDDISDVVIGVRMATLDKRMDLTEERLAQLSEIRPCGEKEPALPGSISQALAKLEGKNAELEKKLEAVKTVVFKMSE
jgi:hypothetical protein